MKIKVFDWETTSQNKGEDFVGKPTDNGKSGGPAPQHPANRGVAVGWLDYDTAEYHKHYVWGYECPEFYICDMLVGHNIRFDLEYTYKERPEFYEWFWATGCKVWDTQLAEYLLSAQTCIMPSLSECCKRHGLEGKIDEVSDMFKQGIQAQEINKDFLLEYLEQDVQQTAQVYELQYQRAQELGMLALIESQMEALVATWEMQHNGMHFEYHVAQQHAQRLSVEQSALEKQIFEIYSVAHPKKPEDKISVGSNDYLSRVLFGGTYTYKSREFIDEHFKNGKQKQKTFDRDATVQGLLENIDVPNKAKQAVKKEGYFEVNDGVLAKLRHFPEAQHIIDLVLKYRQNNKDLSTYYVGFSELSWPRVIQGEQRFFVHGNFNHAITATGRLSSSKPNLQNLSGKIRD